MSLEETPFELYLLMAEFEDSVHVTNSKTKIQTLLYKISTDPGPQNSCSVVLKTKYTSMCAVEVKMLTDFPRI